MNIVKDLKNHRSFYINNSSFEKLKDMHKNYNLHKDKKEKVSRGEMIEFLINEAYEKFKIT